MRFLFLLKYASIVFFVLALARPQNSFKQTQRNVEGIDIMMVLDVSASMNILDLAERSRLEVAKETMENFIRGRGNDRIGFVMFSGEPLTLAPITLDHQLVLKALGDAQIGVLRDGTAIGEGLASAVANLRNSKAKSRVIVLLTDGDNNVGQIDPGTAGELALGYGIRVYTIAIGREGPVKMPVFRDTPMGKKIIGYQQFENALNPELLEKIAEKTQGRFYRVEDENTLGKVFREIDQLEKTDIQTTEKVHYEEIYQKPLKLGVVLLMIEQLLAQGWWRMVP